MDIIGNGGVSRRLRGKGRRVNTPCRVYRYAMIGRYLYIDVQVILRIMINVGKINSLGNILAIFRTRKKDC